ncbi:M50 family metallopeptidase [Amycolatopsis sp. DSM 110486]|uniref:M50 family metallopeptidase n=1 Tax=Amycolatopsis sp. DSM 110486 TaxID=2865832 RepID=UPI001C6A1DFB|nr:M50 family metallopeptidase [Amycolatopsis sp. DSM 110486]QYN17508.1 M50 family metallopeptidase [Amycolatopsis sp. DSM 110486]
MSWFQLSAGQLSGREKRSADTALTRAVSAHHEAGHAVAHKAAGGTIRKVVLDARGHGVTYTVELSPGGRLSELGFVAMLLAGEEAQYRFLTGIGYGSREARRWASVGGTRDRADFRKLRKLTRYSEAEARDEAALVVSRSWGRIERVACDLYERGRLGDRDV